MKDEPVIFSITIKHNGTECGTCSLPYCPPIMKDHLLDIESISSCTVNGYRKGMAKVTDVIWQLREDQPALTLEVEMVS